MKEAERCERRAVAGVGPQLGVAGAFGRVCEQGAEAGRLGPGQEGPRMPAHFPPTAGEQRIHHLRQWLLKVS